MVTLTQHRCQLKRAIEALASMGPRACYDESKRVGETLCYIYSHYHNVHTNIIRPFNVYGPACRKDYRVMPNLPAGLNLGYL